MTKMDMVYFGGGSGLGALMPKPRKKKPSKRKPKRKE